MNAKRLIKVLLIVLSIQSIIIITILIGMLLFFYQDRTEDKCEKYVVENLKSNSNELVYISETEKKELNIDLSLTPVRQYYEIRKCVKFGEGHITDVAANIKDLVSYTLPDGWTESTKSDSQRLSFYSPDYQTGEAALQAVRGASIQLTYTHVDSDLTLHELVSGLYPEISVTERTLSQNRAGLEVVNIFHCFEECFDNYYLMNDSYLLTISYECGYQCNTKERHDNSKYAENRDQFVENIKFR